MIQRRMRLIRRILAKQFGDELNGISLLECGCGNGQWLTEFQMFGIRSRHLAAIELDPERVVVARDRVADADIKQGNAAELPWDDNSFDLVFQSTLFTSILSEEVRTRAAAEMRRVCKDDGLILWYDFKYDSPTNQNVKGIGKSEIRKLFSPWHCDFHNVTLAPPISRKMINISWLLCEIMESTMPCLCTHLIAEIRK